ncbi:MAG: hypothetical protein M0R23_08255 [Bacteroidales bacterium]|nr:hypothetical protein [Bacteroidales bacterium]
MQNKLQELTDKLYNEGLSKGKQEAEDLKAKAKAEAEKIISDAETKAKQILDKAQKDAEELKTKVNNDLMMASNQTISSIKQQVESIIIAKSIESPTKAVMSDTDFIKNVILTIVNAFDATNPDSVPLNLILPVSMQKELESFINIDIAKNIKAGIEVSFVKNISNGFKIGPKDGGYIVSFTESDFNKLIGKYLRPTTRKILFGE